jgi:RNA polymerase sigma-70 factor (ECF subfamily)
MTRLEDDVRETSDSGSRARHTRDTRERGEREEQERREQEKRKDEWLVVRCQLGERPAFDELIQIWHEPLWKYLRRMTGDDEAAGEVTQDVWLRVLRGIGRLRDGARLRAWLFGIARRALMDRWRDRYAAPAISDVELSEIAAEETPGDLEEDLAMMQHELTQLPVIEREVLTLFYLQELTLAEVADVLDVPVGTVKSRLFRARQLLRRELVSKGARA